MRLRAWRRGRRRDDRGATIVELGIIIAGVAIFAIGGLYAVQNALSSSYSNSADSDPGVCVGAGCNAYDTVPIDYVQSNLVWSVPYTAIYAPINTAITAQTPTVTGQAGNLTFTSTGCPAWLSLNANTGRISGTTPAAPESSLTCVITATDDGGKGSTSKTLPITVTPPGLVITSPYPTVPAVQNAAMTPAKPTISGAVGSLTFTLLNGPLPTGLSLNASDGTISGTPLLAAATKVYSIDVSDDGGAPSVTATVSITVYSNLSISYANISTVKNQDIGTVLPTVLGATPAATFSISPALPNSFQFDTGTGGISNKATGQTSGTYTFTVTVTDGARSKTSDPFTISVGNGVQITGGYSNITGIVNQSVATQTPTVTGGFGTKTYDISPDLTADTGLSFSTTTGVISGTPTSPLGTTPYAITVTDGSGSDSVTINVTVTKIRFTNGYGDIAGIRNQAITTQTPATSGGFGTKSYAVSPTLPAGLALNTSTGAISGTPTAVTASATYTVTATDSSGSATTTLDIVVTKVGFDVGYVNVVGVRNSAITSQTPTVSGGFGTSTFSISPAVPAGMNFRTSDGRLSGTPTATSASATYTVTVTDSSGSATDSFTIVVVNALAFNNKYSNFTGVVGDAITSQTPTTTGGSGTKAYSVSPTLPAGLSLNSTTGVLSGTPTSVSASATYTVTVTDASGSDTDTLTIAVVNPVAFTTSYSNVSGVRNSAITSQTPTVSGGYGTKSYAVSPALPAGLTLNTSTGVLSGTPTATSASATYTVTVTDSSGSDTDTFTIVVVNQIAFNSAYSNITGVVNVAITSQTPTTTGGSGTKAYSVSPSLPAGLSLDTSTGVLSGTPTATSASATYTVTVTDSTGSSTDTLTIAITKIAFTTGYTNISVFANNAITTQTPVTAGGSGTKTYSISPAAPTGLTFRTSDGRISGTPTVTQSTTTYTVTVTDTSGSATTTFTIRVR